MGLLSWFYGIDKEEREGEELQRLHRELDADRRARGIWTAEQADAVERKRQAEDADRATWGQQVNAAFKEGSDDWIVAGARGVKNTVNQIGKNIAKGIGIAVPWWVWILLLLYLAFRLGLLKRLLNKTT